MGVPQWLSTVCLIGMCAGTANAQELAFRRLQPLPAESEVVQTEVRRSGDRELVQKILWRVGGGTIEVPLPEPVVDCECALMGEDGLLVLAGGNAEDLRVLLVGSDGKIRAFTAPGARRAASGFADGLGSWPIVQGRRVAMFVYQQGDGFEFRALDFGGRVLASQTLPASATGFGASYDPATQEVAVAFAGVAEDAGVRFAHPDAALLVLDPALVDFGAVRADRPIDREVRVRNKGRFEGVVTFREAPDGIQVRPSELRVPPGGVGRFTVTYRAAEDAAPLTGPLEIRVRAPQRRLRLALRAKVLRPEPEVVEPTPQVPTFPLVPARPRFHFVAVDPCGEGLVIRGTLCSRLPSVGGKDAEVVVRAGQQIAGSASLGENGSFEVVVRGLPRSALTLSVLRQDGFVSPAVPLPKSWLRLRREGDGVLLIARPGLDYRMSLVVLDEKGLPIHALETWSGITDPRGRAELPLAVLGARTATVHLAAWVKVDGAWAPTIALAIEP